ncbi:Hypothetical protein CINCED_3A021848 [Cinara cedri]|uniref:Uncharacterized protein n=1 Tax=Cinara cedri TaxID=506608 RepID=A0A5E4MBP0_9HEMI|nr:Hypothetical protein CINCED_3A021848 [Cinara cedri]
MFELNLFNLVVIAFTLLISIVTYARLRQPLEYRQISQHVPSVTKTLWTEFTLSLELGMKHPKGKRYAISVMVLDSGDVEKGYGPVAPRRVPRDVDPKDKVLPADMLWPICANFADT